MKAVRIHEYGGPQVLKYEEAPCPSPGTGDVLVKVHAAGVNPVDWKVREGHARQWLKYTLPMIPGWDVSGVVEAIGAGAQRFKPGDEVYGLTDILRDGSYADYMVVRETELALKPKSIAHHRAAAIPFVALTAWQALFEAAALRAGQVVLIHGAAGGVGHIAVQLAKWKGATVIGTSSPRNFPFLSTLGVDETINYATVPFESVVHDADVVIDTVSGDTQKRSWKALKRGGILVSVLTDPSAKEATAHGVRAAHVVVQSNAAQLAEIAKLVDANQLKAEVENVLPLQDAAEAQEISRNGHVRGKLVLRVV